MSEEKSATAFLHDQANYKSGYLVKEGGRIKTWRRRLFILDRRNKVLKYYKKAEDNSPKGVIHIEGYTVSDADEVVKKNFSFMISKEGFRTYYMTCEDLAAKNSWIEELRECSKPVPKGGAIPISSEAAHQLSYDDDTDEEEETIRRPHQSSSKEEVTLAYKQFSPEDVTICKPGNKKEEQTLVNRYDPNATLVGYNLSGADPNATLIMDQMDPNATLIGESHPRAVADPNATLIGMSDDNATLVGEGGPSGFALVNNSAKVRAFGTPQVVPHIRMVPYNTFFPVVERDVPRTLKFGRKKDDGSVDPDFVGFDSKVVSRRHAEIWAVNGDFYIRDTKSQSGTFLNAMRLSLPNEESKPFKLKNGDTLQFGVDYRGGTDNTSKCVSVTIELSFTKPTEQAVAKNSMATPNMSDLTLLSEQR